jgi:hypothetical protein
VSRIVIKSIPRVPSVAWLAPAIPYRTDAAVSASSYAFSILVTLLVLGLLITALVVIRRRGWLALSGRTQTPAPQDGIAVKASRRVSMNTTVHVIDYQGASYLLVESHRGATATTTPLPSGRVES